MPTPSRRRPAATALGLLLPLALLLPTTNAVAGATATTSPAAPQAVPRIQPSKPDEVRPVTGTNAQPLPQATVIPAVPRPAATTWPAAGVAETALRTPYGGSFRSALDTRTRAGDLPVWVEGTTPGGPSRVQVRLTRPPDLDGLSVSVRRADGTAKAGPVRVTVDYSGFRDAYGGDWAARLRLTPRAGSQVSAVRNDVSAGQVSGVVQATGTEQTFAVAAAPDGSTGDYKATSLSQSGRWQVSTGAFSWSYPMRTPPVPGDLGPALAAAYNSNAVDGRTVSANNQPSWLGEGFALWPGFIERSYKGCADDLNGNNGTTKTGDLCWETENASLSFGDHSGQLVLVDGNWNRNGTWRLKNDDGTRVEHLLGAANGDDNNEYWNVTTADGTQYFFGRRTDSAWTVPVFGNDSGEPCYTAAFDTSQCTQVYRWNLDDVIDRHGNSLRYFYREEMNNYGANLARRSVQYTRGGTLEHVDYGTRDGQSGQAPARVWFDIADRCLSNCGVHNATTWPDVPWDQECLSGTCAGKLSPTFWSTQRLAKVTTQVSTGGGNYRNVEQWVFTHTFPVAGDNTTASLWLNRITHTGLAASPSITLPDVVLDGTMLQNRVNAATDGLPKLNKNRLTSIRTESGGAISVTYAAADCADGAPPPAPDTNAKRCFPVRWVMPPATTLKDDWFDKYVVTKVVEDDVVGGNKDQVTSYEYAGPAAWAYDDNPLIEQAKRSWTDWRGYEKVVVRKGDPVNDLNKPESWTQHQYFRGMNGDRLAGGGTKPVNVTDSAGTVIADDAQLAGFQREQIVRNGIGGEEVSGEIHTPWSRLTATQTLPGAGSLRAHQLEDTATVARTKLAAGGYRTTRVDSTYDAYGNNLTVNDAGDLASATDDRCTKTTYAQNTATMLVNLPSTETTVGVACGSTPSLPADAISDQRMYYDGGALGASPGDGDPTRTEQAKDYGGGTAAYLGVRRQTFDDYGRVLDSYDALDRKTAKAYTETNGLPTGSSVTNALGHVTTATLDPAWGQPTRTTDANGRVTTMTYDALGRVTKIWKPGRSPEAGQSPHLRFTYQVRDTAPSTIRTDTLKANGNTVASYQLLDGFLRERQTQSPSPLGGRILTDTLYDSRGLVNVKRAPYYDKVNAAGTTLFLPNAGEIPNATVSVYDGAERETDAIYTKLNVEQWRTRTYFGGDYTSTVPPAGGTATATYTDARGNTTKLLQYKTRPATGAPTGPADQTRYGYTKQGQVASVTDPAGNVWRYEYDVLGRRVRSDDPDHGVSVLGYDDAGQLRTATDARGRTVTSRYDALGRRFETRAGSDTGTLITRSVFDTLSKGAQTSSARYAGGSAYTRSVTGFDDAGRPQGETVGIPASEQELAGDYTTTVNYAADDSIASTSLPALGSDVGAETLVYGYDDLGLADTVTGATGYVTDTKYTALGEPTQLVIGTTGKRLWRTTYREEGTRRTTEVLTERELTGGVMLNDQTYGYDQTGNITRIGDRTAGSTPDTQCVRYDYLRRIDAAWTATDDCAATPSSGVIGGPAPYWQEYGYDLTGNRVSMARKAFGGGADQTTTYRYPTGGDGVDRPHAVTSVQTGSATKTYGYDGSGNTVSRDGQALDWSDDGLLESITAAQASTRYVYDADGNQLIRRDPGSVTLFAAGGQITLDTATRSEHGTRYYEGLGARAATGLTWTLGDHHGTSQVAVDAGTLAPQTRRLDLFGDSRAAAGAAGAAAASVWGGGDRGFVGGTVNAVSGLTRLGAREYDPALGRFLSTDPVIDSADPQQMNAYAYSNNNPATMTDPDGRKYYVDAFGYIEAPPMKQMTPAVHKRIEAQVKRYKPMYDAWAKQLKAQRATYHRALQHDRDQQLAEKQNPLSRLPGTIGAALTAGDQDLHNLASLLGVAPPRKVSSLTPEEKADMDAYAAQQQAKLDAMNERARCADSFLCTMGKGASAFGSDIADAAVWAWDHSSTIAGVVAIGCAFVPGANVACAVAVAVTTVVSTTKDAVGCFGGSGGAMACTQLGVGLVTFGVGKALPLHVDGHRLTGAWDVMTGGIQIITNLSEWGIEPNG